jgi:hypothetical protein
VTVRLSDEGVIVLEAVCGSDEAEALLQYLSAAPGAHVDWRRCTQAHTAIVQILLAARPVLHGPPAGDVLRDHVEPAVARTKQ